MWAKHSLQLRISSNYSTGNSITAHRFSIRVTRHFPLEHTTSSFTYVANQIYSWSISRQPNTLPPIIANSITLLIERTICTGSVLGEFMFNLLLSSDWYSAPVIVQLLHITIKYTYLCNSESSWLWKFFPLNRGAAGYGKFIRNYFQIEITYWWGVF